MAADGRGLAFRDPGACDFIAADLGDRRSDHAGKGDVSAGRVRAGDAALLVGVSAELEVDGSFEHPVPALDAVARRVYAVETLAALVVVDLERARRADGEAGRLSELGRGPHAGGQDDMVGGQFAVGSDDGPDIALRVGADLFDERGKLDAHADAFGRCLYVRGHVGVQ